MTANLLSQYVFPLSLFIIMFGMGLTLTPADFTRIFRFPRPALAGLAGQMLLLPLVGFGLAAWLMPTPALAIGLVLLAACPGGVTSNMVSYMARGDLALSVTLTAVSSLLAVFSIPFLVGLAFQVFGEGYLSISVPASHMMLSLILMTLLPIALGMGLRARSLWVARWLEPKISLFGMLFLGGLIMLVLIRQGDQVATGLMSSGVAIVALNLVMMALGLVCALLLRLDGAQSTSITLETGIQNSTLAILIATTFLQDEQLAVPAALYSLIMYVTATVVVVMRRRGWAPGRLSRAAE